MLGMAKYMYFSCLMKVITASSNVAINLWAVHVRISSWCDCKPLLPWPPKYMHAGPNCVSRSLNQVRTLFLLLKRLGVLACQIKPDKLDFLFRMSHLASSSYSICVLAGIFIHYSLLVKTLAIYTLWHYTAIKWVCHCLKGGNNSWGGRFQRKRALMRIINLVCLHGPNE